MVALGAAVATIVLSCVSSVPVVFAYAVPPSSVGPSGPGFDFNGFNASGGLDELSTPFRQFLQNIGTIGPQDIYVPSFEKIPPSISGGVETFFLQLSAEFNHFLMIAIEKLKEAIGY